MTLKANKYKFPPLKLRTNYEYITIERPVLGDPDEFGVRTVTWTQMSTNTKADISPVTAMSASQLKMFEIGLVDISSHYMIVENATDIKPRDRVTDENDNVLDVKEVIPYQGSHKEVLLTIIESDRDV